MPIERTVKRALNPVTGPKSRRAIIAGRDVLVGTGAALRASAGFGAPPSFLVVGAQKAGTTFLYHEVTRHPDVGAALTKEIHFFDDNYRCGLPWYYGFFKHSGTRLFGEASPGYLFHPHAIGRISRDLPNAKLLVLLRDPVRRAFSQYLHERRLGFEQSSTFEEALALEPIRLQGELDRIEADERYVSHAYRHYSYRCRGLYLEQIQRCHNLIGTDKVKILRAEDLYQRHSNVLADVFEFLELSAWTPTEPGRNDMAADGSKRLDPDTEAELRDFYRPHNERLYAYLGWEHGWES
jgi:hypothetical protein